MAKQKNGTSAVENQEAVVNQEASTNGTTEQSAGGKKKKPKLEKIFKSSLDLSEIRNREKRLSGKFNRAARQVKNLGVSQETTDQILALLRTEFETQAKGIMDAPAATEGQVEAAGAEMI